MAASTSTILLWAVLAASLLAASEQQQQQRPSSDPTYGSALAKARFGQGRPFNHFGRRRPQPQAAAAAVAFGAVAPSLPSKAAAAAAVEPSARAAVVASVALSPLPPTPMAAPSRREHAAVAAAAIASGSRSDGGEGAAARQVAGARATSASKPSMAGRNDALRGVEGGSFVVSGGVVGESAANSRQPALASATSSKINMESKLSAGAASGVQVESVRVGGTAILHCSFDDRERPAANQPAQIWWTKLPSRSADRAVVLASGAQVRFPDERLKVVAFADSFFSVLVIRSTVEEDAAEYKCSLPTVTGYKTAFVKLEVKESLESQIASGEPSNFIKAGDDLALFCKSKSGLPLSVWWSAKSADGRAMNVVGAEDRAYGETLSLTSVSKDMEGVYTCHVENKEGAPIRKHFSVALKERPWEVVAYQSGLRADALLWQAARAVPYGEAVELRCDSGGIPKPTVRWLRNGQLLPESGAYHVISSQDSTYKPNAIVSKLSVASLAPSEVGRYTCAIENDVGYREHTFDLRGRAQEANEI